MARNRSSLVEDLKHGLDAPICLTWELTYGCNLACIHCLSSSGRRDPNELTTAEAMAVIDELRAMQVFYVNIGGGEPTIRSDFYELVDYAVGSGVGVKFSTNGSTITPERAERLAGADYVDVQISIDGATAATNDAVRGEGSYAIARRAMDHLSAAGFGPFKVSVVVTRHNMAELDALQSLADGYGAQLRLTRLRPSGRGADTWHELHPTADQQIDLYRWLQEHPNTLTGDSFFHLVRARRSAAGTQPLRRRSRRVPHRPDRRRLRVPVRPASGVPRRQRARRGWLHCGVACLGTVRVAPRAAGGRRVRVVRLVRRLPGRLHGREVLHRLAARRTGSRVRARPR